MLAAVNVISGPAVTAPSGWTLVRRDASAGSPSVAQSLYVRVAGGSEPASYTWTFAAAHGASGGIVAYSGVSNSSPVEASSGQASTTNSVTAPSVTTTAPGSMVVGFFGMNGHRSVTPPAGMSERFEQQLTSPPGEKVTSEVADVLQAAAGATGAKTATLDSASRAVGQLVALRPGP